MGIQPNFDTAKFEELLTGAGVDQEDARAHRAALAQALSETLDDLVTRKDQSLMESRLETAIAKLEVRVSDQSARLEARISDQTMKAITFNAGFVTLIVGLATALIKLTP